MKKILLGLFGALGLAASLTSNAATIDVEFTIDGNTYSQDWVVSNNSTDGYYIEQFVFDLRPLSENGICYDDSTVGTCHSSAGQDFTVADFAQATDTGYLGYDLINAVGGISQFDLLTIYFGDFDSGESFSWQIDVDDNGTGVIYGDDLIGATVYVLMSDGNVYYGDLVTIDGNTDAAQFVITAVSDGSIDDVTGVDEPLTTGLLALSILVLLARSRKA